MFKGIVNLVGGGYFRIREESGKVSYSPTSFTAATVLKFYVGPSHYVFVQGDRIKSVEIWQPFFSRLFSRSK